MKEKNKVDMDDFAEWSQRYLDLNDGWEDLRTCFRREIRFNVKIKSCEDKIQKLEAENKRLCEGLGFYADNDNWEIPDIDSRGFDGMSAKSIIEITDYCEDDFVSGKLARQILKEVGE